MNELIIYFLKLIGLIIIQTTGIVIGGQIVVNYIKKNLTINQKINLVINEKENEETEQILKQ